MSERDLAVATSSPIVFALGGGDHGHVRNRPEGNDGGKVARRIIGHIRIGGGRGRVGGGVDQDRVAVGVRLGDHGGADRAAGAAAVLHHDRLTQLARERIEHDASDDVEGTAGRERNHRPDGLGRPILRPCESGQRRHRECGPGKVQELAARRHIHSSLEHYSLGPSVAWIRRLLQRAMGAAPGSGGRPHAQCIRTQPRETGIPR